MKILAIENEYDGKSSDDFKPYLKDEAMLLWEFYKKSFIRELYFREDKNSAILILESKSVEEAQKNLMELPLVKEKLIYFEIIPLVAYPGFERLFQ